MATKKQKRAIAEAKRKEFMDEIRRTGLEAQRKDREYRMRKLKESQKDQHEKKHSWKKRDPECLWCKDEIRAANAAMQVTNAS